MENIKLPLKEIGDKNWVKELTSFLEKYDVEVEPLEDESMVIQTEERLQWLLPSEIKEYYLHFGGVDSSDFMYNLKPFDSYMILTDADWEFVTINFNKEITDNYIVFSESPSNEPLCINKKTYEISLFSHDPLKYGKVYNNFSDYLINELISLQELYGDIEFDNNNDKINYMSNLLIGEGIDYKFRNIKLE